MRGPEELVKEILNIVNVLREQDMDSLSGDTLSRLAVKLASYKASLGAHVSFAKRQMWDAEATYKLAKAKGYQEMRDDGKGSTDANAMTALYANDSYQAWNQARELESKITTLCMDCHDLIDGIKSRLINLQTEKRESNVN